MIDHGIIQKIIKDRRTLLRQRGHMQYLLHQHRQDFPELDTVRYWEDACIFPSNFFAVLQTLDVTQVHSTEAFFSRFSRELDSALISECPKDGLMPALDIAPRQLELVPSGDINIFWASRDGYCNAYVYDCGAWRELVNEQKTVWPTQNTLDEVLRVASCELDYPKEQLRDVATVYHTEAMQSPGATAHNMKSQFEAYLNPADGTLFDLHWDALDVYIPRSPKGFFRRRLVPLGLGKSLREFCETEDDNLLKAMVCAETATVAQQYGFTGHPAVDVDALHKAIAAYINAISSLFPSFHYMKLSGWFNSAQFRWILQQVGGEEVVLSKSNVLTPWHTVLLKGASCERSQSENG